MSNKLTSISREATFAVLALFFCFSLLNSCKEDTGNIGANVLPKSDLIGVTESDTTTILTSMYVKDSIPTNGTSNGMLGSYNDPIFGLTKASIYSQVFSPGGTITIPWDSNGTPTADSAVLRLLFYPGSSGAYYGNLDPQTVIVDTLENALVSGKSYFSDTNIKYGAAPIAIEQITPANPSISDTITVHLNKSWLNYVTAKMSANSAYYYPNFDSLIKGLYINVSNPLQFPGQGGIWYINLSGAGSAIRIYYHGNTVTTPAQPEYHIDFPVGQPNTTTPPVYFTHIDHNYSTAAFYNARPSGKHDSISGNEFIYVQSMGGVTGRINFPNLRKNWSKLNPVLINEAQLTVSVNAQDIAAPFYPPASLILYGTNSSWQPYYLQDYFLPYYNGIYNAFNNTYTFVITQYIQGVISGKDTDRGLYIIPAVDYITANRVVLYGARHGELPISQQMKLKIYYTPLKP